jgi:hypothetical protein
MRFRVSGKAVYTAGKLLQDARLMSASEPHTCPTPFPHLHDLLAGVLGHGAPPPAESNPPDRAPPDALHTAHDENFPQLRRIASHLNAPPRLSRTEAVEPAAPRAGAAAEMRCDAIVEPPAAGSEDLHVQEPESGKHASEEHAAVEDDAAAWPEHPGQSDDEPVAAWQSLGSDGAVHAVDPALASPGRWTASVEDAPALVKEMDDSAREGRGVGLILGGAGLIFLAVACACFIPPPFAALLRDQLSGNYDAAQLGWAGSLAAANGIVFGGASLFLALAGLGSIGLRRWALPLIHAGAWLAVMSVLLMLAVVSAGYFFIAPPDSSPESTARLRGIARGLIWVGVFGFALPLLYIVIYQRRHLTEVCRRADARSRWTDAVGEPLLMLWLSIVSVLVFLAAIAAFRPAFPLFGTLVTGPGARVLLGAAAAAALAAAWFTARRSRAGWWVAAALFVFLGATVITTLLRVPWEVVTAALGEPQLGHSADADPNTASKASKMAAMLAGAACAPLLMVLLMSRGSFAVHHPPESVAPSHVPHS